MLRRASFGRFYLNLKYKKDMLCFIVKKIGDSIAEPVLKSTLYHVGELRLVSDHDGTR